MPINQANKPVNCISCGKMIAKGRIEVGSIEIPCKCGVMNRIEAEHKPEGQSELCKRVRSVLEIPVDAGSVRMAGRR